MTRAAWAVITSKAIMAASDHRVVMVLRRRAVVMVHSLITAHLRRTSADRAAVATAHSLAMAPLTRACLAVRMARVALTQALTEEKARAHHRADTSKATDRATTDSVVAAREDTDRAAMVLRQDMAVASKVTAPALQVPDHPDLVCRVATATETATVQWATVHPEA